MAKSTKKKLPVVKAKKPSKATKRVVKPGNGKQKPKPRLPDVLPASPASYVLDRLWSVVLSRRDSDPEISHSARLLSRGTAKVAQKFGEEAVECLIEAVAGNRDALVAESADVLYHLLVLWVSAGVAPDEVWDELTRREGISGVVEKAARGKRPPIAMGQQTTKIP
jgi:phosphoribosyl-ATP pyrophosphohydrolase